MIVRRPRLRRPRLLRLGDRHPEPRRAGGERGLRFTNFHVDADVLADPRRAAHRARTATAPGVGTRRPPRSRASPATRWSWPTNAATMRRDPPRRRLRHDDGRQVAPDQGLRQLAAGPQRSWPCQRGFDRYYGFLDAFTNLHQPHRLVEDNHQVEVDRYPDDYYLTDDLTDRAISMIRETQGGEPGASRSSCTSPTARCTRRCTPRPTTSAQVPGPLRRGLGRAARRALRPPAGARRRRRRTSSWRPRNTEAEPRRAAVGRPRPTASRRCSPGTWRSTPAMVDNIDQNVGRLLDALDELGELDNTIFLFTSDNGASREGEEVGTTRVLRAPAAGRRRRRRPRPPRRDRRPADHAALPAWLGDGGEHAVPALQDQHPRRAATRCRSSCRGPDAARRGRRAAAAASTPTSPTCCRRCSSSSASSAPTHAARRRAAAARRARASPPTLADAGRAEPPPPSSTTR